MANFQLGPVGSLINIFPDYSYEFEKTLLNNVHVRTRDGSLFSYAEDGSFTEFRLPLSWVSSSDRALVNSWWETNTDLLFFEDSDQTSIFFNTRIVMDQEPFTTFVRPYHLINYEGEITLQTT